MVIIVVYEIRGKKNNLCAKVSLCLNLAFALIGVLNFLAFNYNLKYIFKYNRTFKLT